ncbi:MAG: efflux RND transporter periplasmic adaptor subunit [Ekhidna sp.]
MKNQTYIYSTFLAAILLFGCSKTSTEESPTSANAGIVEEPISQIIEEVNDEEVTISITGYIDVPPENRAAISPYYGGFVKNIKVLPGQTVKRGETLFTLENPDYLKVQQDYLESKEQLDYLKADYERQKQLADEKITSTKNFKKAESDYKVMLARYQSLKEQLKLMELSVEEIESGRLFSSISIKAPISGSITTVNITKSAFADAKEVAVEIVNLEHIHLELEVFEKDALLIKEGQQISFKIPETGSQVYQGKVHLVGKSIDPKKRTIRVHGHIEEEIEGLIPGMFVEAMIFVK